MYSRFLNNLNTQKLFNTSDKLLLGVSGGVDSVVLTRLVDKLGNKFSIAHCNFNLRESDSDQDEKFVQKLAEDYGVKCYLSSFQTKDYANEKGISIEMAARELRYDWFEKLREANHFDWILVGHHLDDVLETFMLNLSRGTGIRGLSGIKAKAGKIVRPLLFASRNEIEAFAAENEIASRHDASNDDTNIKRNKVRHEILPLLEQLNPAFKKNLQQTIHNLKETEEVYLDKIKEIKQSILLLEEGWTKISKEEIQKLNPLSTYLFEILREYKFKSDVVNEIINSLNTTSGTQFFSETHRLIIDRDQLIITPIEVLKPEFYYIEKGVQFVVDPLRLKITVERYAPDFLIPNSKNVAVFDYDKVQFPLVLRKWQKGEYFKPLGMAGFKKLSDFFVDEKFSIPEKENTWILASDNKVVWIVGKRIDERFKLTNSTKLLLRIEILQM